MLEAINTLSVLGAVFVIIGGVAVSFLFGLVRAESDQQLFALGYGTAQPPGREYFLHVMIGVIIAAAGLTQGACMLYLGIGTALG